MSFSPSVEDEALFDGLRLAILVEGRKITLTISDDGNLSQPQVRDRNAGLGMRYDWTGIYLSIARWKRHEIEFAMPDDYSFTFEVEADHLLPWPRLFDQGGEYNAAEVAVREFRIRATSAYLYGDDKELKKVLQGVPPKIKRLIRTQVWTEIINEIRKEASPCLNSKPNGTSCSTSRRSERVPMQL